MFSANCYKRFIAANYNLLPFINSLTVYYTHIHCRFSPTMANGFDFFYIISQSEEIKAAFK